MKLTIDNFDSVGPRDYTGAVDRGKPPRVRRSLNAPPQLQLQLRIQDPQLPVPAEHARIRLTGANGSVIFTGYLTEQPGYEYLGRGMDGPVYLLGLTAIGDEYLLNQKVLQPRPEFVGRAAGDVLRQLTNELLPGVFDISNVQDLDQIRPYAPDRRKTWSEHAGLLATLARGSYRVEESAVLFETIGKTTHHITESSEKFTPEALIIRAVQPRLNDTTVLGPSEPAAYITDYFLVDATSTTFTPSQTPFERPLVDLLDEQYQNSAIDLTRWQIEDPTTAISINSAALNVNGGTGSDGETVLSYSEKIELGGALTFQHGSVTFTANSQGLIGGLYAGSITIANCVAGFQISPGAAEPNISAFINGVTSGAPVLTVAGHSYTFRTRFYCQEPYRRQQCYHSSVHPAGNGEGGSDVSADVRVVLEMNEIDPANPASAAAPAIVLFDGVIADAPAFVTYALINSSSLHCAMSQTKISRLLDAELRSAVPGEDFHTLVLAPQARDGEADLVAGPELRFNERHPLHSLERITLRYRSSGQAVARMVDTASVNGLASANDNGVRSASSAVTVPAPLTTADCENAAHTLLEDGIQYGYSGEYTTSSDFLPSGDVHPGDAIAIDVPSRSAHFAAIVHQVEIEITNPSVDRSAYTIKFANESAQPLAFRASPGHGSEPLNVSAKPADESSSYIESLTKAEIVSFGTGVVTIDVGVAVPSGHGIELRRSDTGWGPADSANLIGRFTTQQFTVPRLSRIADYYLRAYDAGTPPRYSRYTIILHVNYPL